MEGNIPGWLPIAAVSGVVVIFLFLIVIAKRYTKVGPNEVLVISGRKHRLRMTDGSSTDIGFRVLKGGGTFVWPVVERVDRLSLELFTLDVTTPEVPTQLGVPVIVDGIAQMKIRGDDVSIRTAGEQFLSKGDDEIMRIALQTVEGHLRAILGTLTVEEIYSNRDAFAAKVQEVATADLANMGMQIVSFTIRDIRDRQGYLDALGRPQTAQVKKNAIVGEAEAQRDATIKSAEANMSGQTAKYAADTKVAEAQRDYEMRVAEYTASVNEKKAEADLAYDLQKYKTGQFVKKEEVGVMIIEKQQQIEVQAKEIERKERELNASIKKPADAERYRVETLADAEKFRLTATAEGQAKATRETGFAEADVTAKVGHAEGEAIKAKGVAEADVILAQGTSTAEAMALKAKAWQEYNEAAIAEILITRLPEIAAAVASPLSQTERIVVVNSGEGGAGASKITRDITDIIAQLPPIVESLTGTDLEKLLQRISKMKSDGKKKTDD
jgi:flotillin